MHSQAAITSGRHRLGYEFEPTGKLDLMAGKGTPGHARLLVDGDAVDGAEFPVTVPLSLGIGGGLAVGRNPGSPITTMYASPFAFTGTIQKVTISTSPAEHHDHEEAARAEARVAMARQ